MNKIDFDHKGDSRTRSFWESRYSHPLSPDNASEITRNVSGFFTKLHSWLAAEEQEHLTLST